MNLGRSGCLGWVLLAIVAVFVVQSPEAAAGLFTTVFTWIGDAANALGVFVEAVS